MRSRALAGGVAMLVLLTLLLAGCGPAARTSPSAAIAPSGAATACTALTPGDRTISLEADGRKREALVHVPPVMAVPGGLPALVALHGYSSNAVDFSDYSGLSIKADEVGFVVVYPQALGDPREWHIEGWRSNHPELATSDRELAGAVLDWLAGTGCVDPGRVFLAGHSQGGGMAGDLACDLADRLSGVGLVSAMHLHMPCEPARPIPVFVSHAVDDPVLPFEGGRVAGTPSGFPNVLPVENVAERWAVANGCAGAPDRTTNADGTVKVAWTGCGAPAVFYRLPSGGHDWTPVAGDAMWAFFSGLPAD